MQLEIMPEQIKTGLQRYFQPLALTPDALCERCDMLNRSPHEGGFRDQSHEEVEE